MSDAPLDPVQLPGALLRQARETAGLSVADMARSVNLQVSVIEALEADDYERLPGLPFVRGYLTNLQRKLGLPEAAVLGVFDEWRGQTQPKPVAANLTHGVALVEPRQPMAGKIIAGLLILSVVVWATVFDGFSHVVAWVSPVQEARDSNQLIRQPSAQEAASEPTAPEAASVELPMVIDLPSNEPAALPADAAEVIAQPVYSTEAPVVETEEVAAPVEIEAEPTPVAAEGHRLQMRFTGDSWIEVTGADGRLVGDLKKRDETVDLTGPGPFNILVGNVTATQLTFDGQVIDLQSRARQNVARIQLP